MAYQYFDQAGEIGVTLSAETLALLFADAAAAFTETLTPLDGVEPRRPEELDVDAPELELLLAEFLTELLYRFDTREWLTRLAELDVREKDGGWTLQGTLSGERLDPSRHTVKAAIRAVSYQGLLVQHDAGVWTATVVFDV